VARAATRPPLPHAQRTFQSFVVGECNALALEASLAVLRETGPGLSQLYLCSEPGLGKTHLSRAVCAEARATGRRPVYTSAEAFTNEFLASLRSRQMGRFKRKYRHECDVLVVEDVHFLQGKRSTQLEFFHTVQHVLDAGGRVLLTGNSLPRALGDLEARVRSQVAGGFVAELGPPDAQVRSNILRQKAAAGGVHLPENCLAMLVESIRGSVRDLESVLIQLVTTASLLKKRIDASLTREALDKKGAPANRTPAVLRPADVIQVVASSFKTTRDVMASKSRRRDVLVPRQLAMYLCRRYTDSSLVDIGRALGRDHPSVRNAVCKVERAILERAPMRYQVEALVRKLDELAAKRS
jgi:chromosomal replication initiator protein